MMIGCLTGNGKRSPVAGTYTFHAPGLIDPLPPDLQSDRSPGSGPFSFPDGALTDGDAATGVGWQAGTAGETGVDVAIHLGARYFVDRVILHQAPPEHAVSDRTSVADPGAGGIEALGHVEPEGLSSVEVYAASPCVDGLALVGRAGQRGSAVLPAGPIPVSVGVEAAELVVRLISDRRDVRLVELEVWGADPKEPAILPVPAEMERRPGPSFVLARESVIWVGPTASDDTWFAAAMLAEKLQETFGRNVPVAQEEKQVRAGTILIGKPGESTLLASAGPPSPGRPEGYALEVEAQRVAILAADRRGLIYGVESFLQLLAAGDRAPAAAPCLVVDAPRLPFRGVHLFLPAREQIDYTKRLIRHLLVPMKLNTIFLELAGGMRFDRRPEISETWERNNRLAAEGKAPPVPHGEVSGGGWLTKAEVKDLVDYARSYGIEVIPEIQSLSHVQYLTMTYPEIAEKPVENGYPDSYCPLHPESRRIVFDMIDEVLDLLGPLRYIHMGHDEVYTMAECPRCKGKPRDELYAHDVNAIHDYLQAKGVGMMVWADMLQPWQYYAGQNAAALIPKDIVMLEFVWYFRTWADTEDLLLGNGFKVIFGNCYSSHFTRYEHRTSKEGVIGTQVSVWASTSEEDMGRLGKLYDLIYSANTSWSAYCQDELRWTFDRKIVELLPGIRSRLHGQSAPLPRLAGSLVPIDVRPHLNAPRRDPTGGKGGYDLSGLPAGEVMLRGLPFHLGDGVVLVENRRIRSYAYPEQVTIPVEAQALALVFAHTCTAMGPIDRSIGARQPIARYQVQYADGTAETVDVAFGHHVAEWNRRHGAPLGHRFHRHAGYVATYPVDPLWQGKTALGEDVTLYGMEWLNPHPGKKIQSVCIASVDTGTNASLAVVGITVVQAAG
jgi:hypothetical protein